LAAGEAMWTHFYHRVADRLGGITHHLVPQAELARLANPFYHQLTRGGEGHLEVGKNVYYTINHLCHMVLALKPFGCMPSSQSDGVQSAVINRHKDMVFLPIETSGEGEVNAHSRVQMALGEAKAKAKAEFEAALKTTGKRLEDIKGYVAEHAELRRPFYPRAASSGNCRHGGAVHHARQRPDGRKSAGNGVTEEPFMQNELMVGLDVGSTTVEAVVVRRENDEMIWQDYQRHETKAAGEVAWNFAAD